MNHVLKINESEVEAFVISGEVLNVAENARTDYSERWSVLANSNITHKERIEETKLVYRDEQGNERVLNFPKSIVVLVGHKIKVFYAKNAKKDDAFHAIAMDNLNLANRYCMDTQAALNRLERDFPITIPIAKAGMWMILATIILAIVLPSSPNKVALWFLIAFGFAATVIDVYVVSRLRFLNKIKAVEAQITEGIDKIFSQEKSK